jgi:hypothetical protein
MAEANPKYVLPPEMKKYIDDNLGNMHVSKLRQDRNAD